MATPRVPYQTPMYSAEGALTNPWVAFFRDLASQSGTGGGGIGPQGPQGPTGPAGPQGPTGTRGSLWSTGAVAPSVTTGYLNGDMYLDTSSDNVWELVSGSWALQCNISGSTNLDGGQANTNYGGNSSVNGGTA